MNIGIRFLQIAVVYLVVGLAMGLGMGITGNFALTSVHAHISLLGWTAMALTGIIYLLMPRCSRSALARVHFWGHNIGLPVMMACLGMMDYGIPSAEPLMGIASAVVLASLVVFAVNLFLNAGTEPASA